MFNKLSKYFLDIKPHFEEGGKFKSLYPLYEAFDSFLFSTTKSTPAAPHVRDAVDLGKGRFRLRCDAEPPMERVADFCHQRNWGLREIYREERSLEQLFVELTMGAQEQPQ